MSVTYEVNPRKGSRNLHVRTENGQRETHTYQLRFVIKTGQFCLFVLEKNRRNLKNSNYDCHNHDLAVTLNKVEFV